MIENYLLLKITVTGIEIIYFRKKNSVLQHYTITSVLALALVQTINNNNLVEDRKRKDGWKRQNDKHANAI